jgi:hypothetical protein
MADGNPAGYQAIKGMQEEEFFNLFEIYKRKISAKNE